MHMCVVQAIKRGYECVYECVFHFTTLSNKQLLVYVCIWKLKLNDYNFKSFFNS